VENEGLSWTVREGQHVHKVEGKGEKILKEAMKTIRTKGERREDKTSFCEVDRLSNRLSCLEGLGRVRIS
jgi:hypothetical protein